MKFNDETVFEDEQLSGWRERERVVMIIKQREIAQIIIKSSKTQRTNVKTRRQYSRLRKLKKKKTKNEHSCSKITFKDKK